MVKRLRLYTGLGFDSEVVGDNVVCTAIVAGSWYLDMQLIGSAVNEVVIPANRLPGYLVFEAVVNGQIKTHKKWVQYE